MWGQHTLFITMRASSETTVNDEYDDKGYFTLTGPSQQK